MDTIVIDSVVRNAMSHPRFQLRSMQRDEIEPTEDEKYNTLKSLLDKDPAIFLERYGVYLGGKSLLEFKRINNNYEVEWYVNNLQQKLDPAIKKEQEQVRRNRRYIYLAQLLKTDYFSEENMRLREPNLYHNYIGQYKDEEFSEDLPLSEKLLKNMDYSESVDKRVHQRMDEDSESDSDEMEEDGVDPESMNTDDFPEDYDEIKTRVLRAREKSQRVLNKMKDRLKFEAGKTAQTEPASESELEDNTSRDQSINEDPVANKKPRVAKQYVDEQDKEDKEREFLDIMKERFVNGEDGEFFTYADVDNNPAYDDVDQMQRDYEERYFDED